jgi:Fic family protein
LFLAIGETALTELIEQNSYSHYNGTLRQHFYRSGQTAAIILLTTLADKETQMNAYQKTVKMWKGFNVRTEADIDMRLENFRVLFAYNSSKIENPDVTLHDTREIFENGKAIGFTGAPRALFELQNQKLAYELIKPKLVAKERLSFELIKEIHAALTGGTYDERRYVEKGERPGTFKRHDYVTGREEVGSAAENVEQDLGELLEEIADYEGKDVTKIAAYFHARFEYIHPFADGNGRVGRTLLNYYLMRHGYPPTIIYDEDKANYYMALEAYDTDEELEPLRLHIMRQTVKTWTKTLEREERRSDRSREQHQ